MLHYIILRLCIFSYVLVVRGLQRLRVQSGWKRRFTCLQGLFCSLKLFLDWIIYSYSD